MKSFWRLGALAALIAGLVVLATPGGGLHDPSSVEAAPGNNLTVRVDDASGGADHQVLITRPGACTPTSAALDDGQSSTFLCAEDGVWTVTIDPTGDTELTSISCLGLELDLPTAGQQSDLSDFDTLNGSGTYVITILDTEDFDCTFSMEEPEVDPNPDGEGGLNPDAFDPLDPDGDGIIVMVAIAVTADPNVIPCGGTAKLTATARAVDTGLVVPSELLGFHWETDIGQLNVGPPNTAEAADNFATLTLVPGMGSATVRAWVGDLSQNPGEVLIQQFCPGVTVDNDQSIAAGALTLSASSNAVTCGETIFLGARVRDSKNQVVPNDTLVSFIASAGEFQTGEGVVTDYSSAEEATVSASLKTVSQYTAGTLNGVLNLTYIAPLINGEAIITAASGDKFSKLVLTVSCASAPATVSGGGGYVAPKPACTPIGDGICISPPNTGARITPPSTGSAGLK